MVQFIPDPDAAVLGGADLGGAGSSGSSGSSGATPRLSFAILPAAAALPPPASSWQRLAGGALLLLALGSTLQFSLSASVGLLPAETLAWLASPAAQLGVGGSGADALPPGLELYDPLPFFSATGTVFLTTLLPQLAHETGHGVSAAVRGLRIAPSLLLPYTQLGVLGSVTQLKSMARNRRQEAFWCGVGGWRGVGGGGGAPEHTGGGGAAAAAAALRSAVCARCA